MSSLTRYERFDTSDGIELIIDTQTGESFASISGYARMSGRALDTIAKRVRRGSKGLDKSLVKTAKIQTPGGLQGVDLIDEITISQWIIKDNPDLAFKMLQSGVRVYLHTAAGYQVTSTAIQKDFKWVESRTEGKVIRTVLTDATKDYIERHSDELTDKQKKYLYAEISDELNLGLFGLTAQEMKDNLGCDYNKLRDQFTREEIFAIKTIEDMGAYLINSQDMYPVNAITQALKASQYMGRFIGRYDEPRLIQPAK